MKCGNRIAELRKQRGIPQYALAEKINISRGSLSHYENNRRKPDYETIVQICRYFNVSIDYILGNAEKELPISTKTAKINVELTNKRVLKDFLITIDGRRLTWKELSRAVSFIKVDRMMDVDRSMNEYGVTS